LRSLPDPLASAEQARIRDARPAGPPPTPPAKRDASTGASAPATASESPANASIRDTHAGRIVTVEEADTTFRVYDGEQLLAEVARTTTKPIARFEARKPELPRSR
jgi:hypothetical protein